VEATNRWQLPDGPSLCVSEAMQLLINVFTGEVRAWMVPFEAGVKFEFETNQRVSPKSLKTYYAPERSRTTDLLVHSLEFMRSRSRPTAQTGR
jgi:hypothetical protein